MNILSKISVSALLTLGLTACGGGGGGSSDNDDQSTAPVSGTASKGIISSGNVSVWAVEDNGQQATTPLAQFQTSEQGEFTGLIDANVGQTLYFEVRGRSDGSSRMFCDLTDCGEATNDALDTNNNGRVDFGEWTEIDEQTFLSAYAEYQGSGTPIRINLLTHLVSQSFALAPSNSELESAYTDLQDLLQLTVPPNEVPPLLVTEDSSMTKEQVQDNMMMQGLLSNLSDAANISAAIDDISSQYATGGGFQPETVSFANVSSEAIQLTEALTETAPAGAFASGVKETVSDRLSELNATAANTENKLAASDLPLLPPGL